MFLKLYGFLFLLRIESQTDKLREEDPSIHLLNSPPLKGKTLKFQVEKNKTKETFLNPPSSLGEEFRPVRGVSHLYRAAFCAYSLLWFNAFFDSLFSTSDYYNY